MDKETLINGYESWLNEYHWSLFGTLAFRGFPSASKANRLFREWIHEMQEQDGRDEFRSV